MRWGEGAGWPLWCNTAIKRNSFADRMNPALSLLGKEPHGSEVRDVGRIRDRLSLYPSSPKVQSCASHGGMLGPRSSETGSATETGTGTTPQAKAPGGWDPGGCPVWDALVEAALLD